ncbi:MAG: hypothetical protein NWE89_00345 [Candidatus Bathyarchaeota archaeon]|nr:hypothetical protein [Candidatus Bathyarchaeota archaeon]
MVKFIVFCEMTPEFLRLPLEERQSWIPKWTEIAKKYGIKTLFQGNPMGIREHTVFAFETIGNGNEYFMFQREWLALGTPDAVKYIKNTRTITVY